MKFLKGQVVVFAFAMIVLSDALPTDVFKLLKQSQLKNVKRSPHENLLRMLAEELDAPVRRSGCTYYGSNYDFGELIYSIEGGGFCLVVYCDQQGTVVEETKPTCGEPEVTSAPRNPDNGMPAIGK